MSKTIFITGATDGIGKLTAIQLAKAGHRVLLHGRSEEKLSGVLSELEGCDVKGFVCDLEAYMSIKTMVMSIDEDLDVLINNAGIFNSNPARDIWEVDRRLKVNYLAPYLLTKRLMPRIKEDYKPQLGSARCSGCRGFNATERFYVQADLWTEQTSTDDVELLAC